MEIEGFNLEPGDIELIIPCRITILDLIGKGWEAELYKAIDQNGAIRTLKIFDPTVPNDEFAMYCRRLVKLAPENGIIDYICSGFIPSIQSNYIIHNYIEGVDLETSCNSQFFTLPEALLILEKLLLILSVAHGSLSTALGDIHSGNVLLTTSGDIVIIDFDAITECNPITIQDDIVEFCKLFYSITEGQFKDYPKDLRRIIPIRDDLIRKKYTSAGQLYSQLKNIH